MQTILQKNHEEKNSHTLLAAICIGVALRSIISLHSYSGKGKEPLFGDYEAQRHWQEITLNVKAIDWYKNSSQNDLQYWGLDYPPLTAYHSYLMGKLGASMNQSFTELGSSRGIESADHKNFMRFTVLAVDILIYIPGILLLGQALEKTFKLRSLSISFLSTMLLYPGQILIDNGHFQYNNFSLGLAALAIAAILRDRHKTAALCFSLALNYKQMELYHALPFFSYLLNVSLCQNTSLIKKLQSLLGIGMTVVLTFGILWLPWLGSFEALKSVSLRLFPIGRGVFEDKVANFWCTFNIFYKLKAHYTNSQMALICLWTTMAMVLPINIMLFIRPKKQQYLMSLISTAMVFYLFSFQVHEKSILLVALPASCMLAFNPDMTLWFLETTVFSMLPLLMKDQLSLACFALFGIFHIVYQMHIRNLLLKTKTAGRNLYLDLALIPMLILSLCLLLAPVPAQYPYLWSLMISLYSFISFVTYFLFIIYHQLK